MDQSTPKNIFGSVVPVNADGSPDPEVCPGIGKTLCVDLDGVLAQYEDFTGVTNIGDPIPLAKEFMEQLKAWGYRLIVYTARLGEGSWDQEGHTQDQVKEIVEQWFSTHNIPYDMVYTGRGKPRATAYIDDHAVACMPLNASKKYNLDEFCSALHCVLDKTYRNRMIP